MKKLRIYPYKMGSSSASLLRKHIKGALKVYQQGNYRPKKNHVILCWGGRRPAWVNKVGYARVLNHWDAALTARDKRLANAAMKEAGVNVPEATTDHKIAKAWLLEGIPLIQYRSATAQGGAGVSYLEGGSTEGLHVNSEMWSKYIKKKHEFRVHVFRSKVIDVTRKAKRVGVEVVDTKIRNVGNGWVFKRHDIEVPDDVKKQAIAAVAACELDFGGVDVIYNEQKKKAYVLEVNTAPGIEGTTLEKYVTAINKELTDV